MQPPAACKLDRHHSCEEGEPRAQPDRVDQRLWHASRFLSELNQGAHAADVAVAARPPQSREHCLGGADRAEGVMQQHRPAFDQVLVPAVDVDENAAAIVCPVDPRERDGQPAPVVRGLLGEPPVQLDSLCDPRALQVGREDLKGLGSAAPPRVVEGIDRRQRRAGCESPCEQDRRLAPVAADLDRRAARRHLCRGVEERAALLGREPAVHVVGECPGVCESSRHPRNLPMRARINRH